MIITWTGFKETINIMCVCMYYVCTNNLNYFKKFYAGGVERNKTIPQRQII